MCDETSPQAGLVVAAMTVRLKWAVALVLVLAWAAPIEPVAEAAQRPGGRYDGRLPQASRSFVQVAEDGTQLRRYQLDLATRCSDGQRFGVIIDVHEGGQMRIDPSGRFAFAIRRSGKFPNRRGRMVRGVVTDSASGQFSASGESVTGTTSYKFTSRTLRCSSGAIPYTLHLDGTAGAPFRTGALATGDYAMSGSRGLSFRGPLRVFGPSETLSRFRYTWYAPCEQGSRIGFHEHVVRDELVRGHTTSTGTHRFRLPGGIPGRYRWRLSMRFSFNGAYIVRGRFSVSVSVRGKRGTDRCRLRNARFSGRFLSGPANTF